MGSEEAEVELGRGGRVFRRLGLGIARHPWYPVAFWIVLLLASLPLLAHLGDATKNSATNLPANSPSERAAAELARLFPNASAPATSFLLLTGPDMTDPTGVNATLGVANAVAADPNLTEVGGVASLYWAYSQYLYSEAGLALGFLTSPQADLRNSVASSAQILWRSPAMYLANWSRLVASHPGTAPDSWNYPAFVAVTGGNVSLADPVLSAFYAGDRAANGTVLFGFNSSAPRGAMGNCAQYYPMVPPAPPGSPTVEDCANATVRATAPWVLPAVGLSAPNESFLVDGTLAMLGLGNFSSAGAIIGAVAFAVGEASGLPWPFVARVASSLWAGYFRNLPIWVDSVVRGPVSKYPLPIPAIIRTTYLSPDRTATLIVISFRVSDSATGSGGKIPVYDDIAEVGRVAAASLRQWDPSNSIRLVQTGPAALDADETAVLAQNLAIVLPLTFVILLAITILYFRAPGAPVITFGGLGIALGLGIAGLVGLAELFGKVDPTAITLENTFVLGVGTDYSIFLVARYREELYKGRESKEAVVTAVTWAGQSVATSGGTAILATLALAFSGVGLLSQWGMTLSLAVLITVLVSLTLVPALLVLIGPRTFWPEVGERARRRAESERRRWTEERGYFFRAGRRVQRQPGVLVVAILAVSVPLVYVAVVSPLGYDFYQQLPRGSPATDGLQTIADRFGAGASFPSQILVTFSQPLEVGGHPNATEFTDLGALTTVINGTAGVARVLSPVGLYGAPLTAWLAASSTNLSPSGRLGLDLALAPYLGSDGRTVALTVVSRSAGLSAEAVSVLTTLKGELTDFARTHPSVQALEYGGGASVTSDLAAQTALATERMILAVSIGLLVVLFVALRSFLIPPMAVATIGLSIGWAWGLTQIVFARLAGLSLYFFVPTVLFILILGLGIDYNIFLLTRVREERLRGHDARESVRRAVASTGGIITAAAVILAGAFTALTAGDFVLLRAIGFSVAAAVVLDAMVVRTYLVPSLLQLLGERAWRLRRPPAGAIPAAAPSGATPEPVPGSRG